MASGEDSPDRALLHAARDRSRRVRSRRRRGDPQGARRGHRGHDGCHRRGRAFPARRSARHHRAQGAAGEPLRSRGEGRDAGGLRADAGAARRRRCMADSVRARARRGRRPVRLPAARRRYGLHAGSADDLDHRVRARTRGQDGPSQRRETRRPRRGDGDDRRRRARSRYSQGRRGRRCARRRCRGKGEMLVGRYRVPQPRNALAQAVRDHASAAMDVSDGLAGDLAKLCAASGVSAVDRRAEHPVVRAPPQHCSRAAPSASRPSSPAATTTRFCARSPRIALKRSRRRPGSPGWP